MNLEKEKKIIKFINNIPIENTQVAFSGGKDSIVLYYFCKLANIDVPYIYGNTTIDPKGTIKMIKTHYNDVHILQPKNSYYKLIENRGLPTRVGRFCCQELKEIYGIGKNNIEGVRWEESSKRNKYEPIQCDSRAWMKNAKHYYPIIDLTENDIWQIIKTNNLPYLPYYDEPYNWKRHGCVGCPLSGGKQMIKEFKVFPKNANAIIKSIRKNINTGKSLSKISKNPYEVFWWWISEKSIKEWKSNKSCELFEIDYEKQYNRIINGEK